jgi:uncharacterized membrane protein YfcA
MLNAKVGLFIALGVFGCAYIVYWVAEVGRDHMGRGLPSWLETAVGFVTNFFDTLGIGSFATTTSIFRFFKMVPDEKIPGTLNVGHTAPTLAQAFIYIAIVQVDMKTLILMITASVAGSWLGAGVVSKWSRRTVQIAMGLALLAAATLFLMAIFKVTPAAGDSLSLEGWRLYVGLFGNFVLGALMTLGIGLYGPCLILISLLSMNPKAAFPIMMGSCAFLMPVGSMRFIKAGSYSLRPSLGLALGGVPAVLIAAYLVKEMPLDVVRWLVVAVVLYTSITMLHSAYAKK